MSADRALRVALLHPVYWPEVRRGSERFLHDLGTGLAAAGRRPTLITSHGGADEVRSEAGFEVVLNRRPRGQRLQLGLAGEYLLHLPATRRTLREREFDLVHSAYPSDALLAAGWAKRTGRPHVFSAMGMPRRPGVHRRRIWRRLQARALARADVVTALSAAAAARIDEQFGRDDARVIYPGVDLARFRSERERSASPKVLCLASIADTRKRVGLLIEAIAILRRERPDVRLVLSKPVGPGAPVVDATHEWIDLIDPEPSTIADVYRDAWLTVLPSFDEAFGLVLVESLACGTPVVGANDGAIPEIVADPAYGRLFEEPEPDALAAVIDDALALAESPGIAETCRARARAFSVARFVEAYERLYEELA